MPRITRDQLRPGWEDFNPMDLLEAVEAFDQIRYLVADDADLRPPNMRLQLLQLHQLLFRCINEGVPIPAQANVWGMVWDMEEAIAPIVEHAERLLAILAALWQILPDPEDLEDAAEDSGNHNGETL